MRLLTTEEYIKSCKIAHGDVYDYSKTIYKHSLSPVVITCKKHGDFNAIASAHKSGGGKCRICSERSPKSKLEYIKLLNEVHNSSYEYPLSQEFHSHKKLSIICKIHGQFRIRLSCHVQGQGCTQCNIDESGFLQHEKTIERIESSNFVIGIFYKDTVHSYKFHCSTHGDYYKSPQLIRAGFSGCPNCAVNAMKPLEYYQDYLYEKTSGAITIKTNEEFPCQSRIYTFICSTHGEFRKRLDFVIKHTYCKKCGRNGRMTEEEFKKRANEIHNYEFDYCNSIYKNYDHALEIICKKHGSFFQTPNSHLSGSACPKCSSSRGEKRIRKILQQYEVSYLEQKTFNGCISKNKLRFDFYLPQYNCAIEFHGIQHYLPVRWSQKQSKQEVIDIHNLVKERDEIKRQYCKENSIRLLEIKYTDYNNIEQILKKEVLENKK
jgi:hypothetical protein